MKQEIKEITVKGKLYHYYLYDGELSQSIRSEANPNNPWSHPAYLKTGSKKHGEVMAAIKLVEGK